VTESAKSRRRLLKMFLNEVFEEGQLTNNAVADALKAAGKARSASPRQSDIRNYLIAYRAGKRTITPDVAFDLGQAFAALGITWINGAVLLYASGHYSDWISFLWHLRRFSLPSAILVAIVTPLVAPGGSNPFLLSYGKRDDAAPAWMNDEFETTFVREPRSQLARVSQEVVAEAGRAWYRSARRVASDVVKASEALKQAPLDLQQVIIVSLAIHLVSSENANLARLDSELDARELYTALLGFHKLRLPMFRPGGLSESDVRGRVSISASQVEVVLDRFFPAMKRQIKKETTK
jgi:hypothetical protein